MISFKKFCDISLLEEAAKLTYAEFAKPKTAKRPDRKAIFLDKYKNGQPFKVSKDGETKDIIFDVKQSIVDKIETLTVGNPDKKSEEYKQAKSTYDSIVLSDVLNLGDKYSLNDLLKVKEFTGQGSGAGADNTKLNEASVCLWAAVYQEAGIVSYDVVRRLANSDAVSQYYDTDEDVDRMIEQKDEKWIRHYENVAEYLPSNVLKDSKYVFHRGSSFVKKIYNRFNYLNKTLAEPFANSNKWNPADIWAVSTYLNEQDAIGRLESAPDVYKFNNILVDLYTAGKLIGISLKKTDKKVHSTEYNITQVRPKATFLSQNPGAGRKGIFTKDVYIKGVYSYELEEAEEDYSIQFRSFNPWSDFQGEIKGKTAALGKVAHGVLNRILTKNGVERLPDLSKIRDIAVNNTQNSSLLEEMFNNFISLGGELQDVKTSQEYIERVQNSNSTTVSEDYIFSKYFGLKLLTIMNSLNEETKNKVMSDIIGYALSSSEASGPFVKIH